MKREEREEEEDVRCVSEWMAVKGGGAVGHQEAEDTKSEAKVWEEDSEVRTGV